MDRPQGRAGMPLWLRWAGIALGVSFMLWLPIEDIRVNYVVGLSCGVCAWIVTRNLAVRWGRLGRRQVILVGGAAGLCVPLLAVGLMVFKAGLHAHGFLDFANSQIIQVLQSTPWWVLAGIFVSGFATLLSKNS